MDIGGLARSFGAVRHLTSFAILLAAFLLPASLEAGETYDLLFKQGTLATVETGESLTYSQMTTAPQRDPTLPATQAYAISLSIDEGQATLKRATGEAETRTIGAFDAEVGNPLAMYFLEHTIKNVARATGGSPFYIRNRIKESLLRENEVGAMEAEYSGETIPVREILIRPFDGDQNAARFGPFAALELRAIVGDDVPGWYLSLSAETPAGADGVQVYADRVSLEGME